MKGKKGKIYAFLLTLCMLLTMIPATVFAADYKTLEFDIWETNSSNRVLGATGTVSIIRDEEVIQVADIVEGENFYTAQIDVSGLLDTDSVLIDCFANGYMAPNDGSNYGEEYIGYWASIDYTVNSIDDVIIVNMEPWPEGMKAYTENYVVFSSAEGGYVSYYAGPWDENAFLKAFSYIKEGETIDRVEIGEISECTFAVSALSGNVMSTISKYPVEFCYCFDAEEKDDPDWGFAYFETIKATKDFAITLDTTVNDAIKKELEANNITCSYLSLDITGDAVFTGSDFMFSLSDELAKVLTIPADKIESFTQGGEGERGSDYKGIYKYNAKKNYFESCGAVVFDYLKSSEVNDGKAMYSIYINTNSNADGSIVEEVLTGSGNYIITNEILPILMTVPPTTVEGINTSMTTEEVTTTVTNAIEAAKEEGKTVEVPLEEPINIGADAMKAASDNNVPIVIEISDDATKSSFVNWSFDKITNPVEFNPSVHVDATVEAINTRLAGVTLPSTLKKTTVSFEFSGDLPGEANVTLNMADSGLAITDTAEGKVVFLYYFNPVNGVFELIDKAPVTGGYATFKMEHCSDYIVTTEELPTDATTDNSGNGGTGTTQPGGGATQPGGGAGQPDPGATTTQPDAGTNTGETTQPDAGTTTPTSPKTGDTTVVAWIMVFALAMGTMLVIKKRNIIK